MLRTEFQACELICNKEVQIETLQIIFKKITYYSRKAKMLLKPFKGFSSMLRAPIMESLLLRGISAAAED